MNLLLHQAIARLLLNLPSLFLKLLEPNNDLIRYVIEDRWTDDDSESNNTSRYFALGFSDVRITSAKTLTIGKYDKLVVHNEIRPT